MDDLQAVGYFHFGDKDKSDPIRSLKDELRGKDLSNALIVLPEAFNVPLGSVEGSAPDLSVGPKLRQICVEQEAAFVVGMIEEPTQEQLGCNSAYLVDSEFCHLLARKSQTARNGLYRRCLHNVPLPYRGLLVAALVCNDSSFDRGAEQQIEKFMRGLAVPTGHTTTLCIPSCMGSMNSSTSIVSSWAEFDVVVLANGGNANPSVLRTAVGGKLTLTKRESNHIEFQKVATSSPSSPRHSSQP